MITYNENQLIWMKHHRITVEIIHQIAKPIRYKASILLPDGFTIISQESEQHPDCALSLLSRAANINHWQKT